MIKTSQLFIGIVAAVVFGLFSFYMFSKKAIAPAPDLELEEEVANDILQPTPTPTPQPTPKTETVPDDARFVSFLHLARSQFHSGQLTESRVSYLQAIENGHSDIRLVANAWYELHEVLISLKDIEGARRALDKAVEMDPNNETFLNAKNLFELREQNK